MPPFISINVTIAHNDYLAVLFWDESRNERLAAVIVSDWPQFFRMLHTLDIEPTTHVVTHIHTRDSLLAHVAMRSLPTSTTRH